MSEPDAIILVVDDDATVRGAVECLIRSAGWKVAAFASAQEFLAHPRADGPSCLILDVHLPGLSGLDLQDRLAQTQENIPIIFMTGDGDIPTSVRAMRSGAVDFLTKPFSGEALLDAIRRAIDQSRASRLEEASVRAIRECQLSLTPREREVMKLVASGLSNRQVAAELNISQVTVKLHRAHVMAKMGATSLAALVRMAERLKL